MGQKYNLQVRCKNTTKIVSVDNEAEVLIYYQRDSESERILNPTKVKHLLVNDVIVEASLETGFICWTLEAILPPYCY